MTAEVAILNKLGVALAADSTVTIGRDKTYNTTNKLFTLSKFHPVGILIYGSTEFTDIPLEILIKEFREKLGSKSEDALTTYSDNFIEYLRTKVRITPEEEHDNVAALVSDHCDSMIRRLRDQCSANDIELEDPSQIQKVRNALYDIITRASDRADSVGEYPQLSHVSSDDLRKKYPKIEERVRRKLRRFKLNEPKMLLAISVVCKAILSNSLSGNRSGIVIAGYGSDEYYPTIIQHETDGFIVGVLKVLSKRPRSVAHDNQSIIYPLAQRDVAELFMEGIDPYYKKYINEGITDSLVGMAETSAKYFGITDKSKISRFKRRLKKNAQVFIENLDAYRRDEFVHPVLRAVRYLDKVELAMLAESLVEVTAIKQKISLDIETVGGPIDVAVISKNDGFIWIKRKHYFDGKLNPFFIRKYLPEVPTK